MNTLTTYLPNPMQIRELLTDLLGREVTVSPTSPLAPTPNNPCTIAAYVDSSLQILAVVAFDLNLSARAGAAIGLVPPAKADAVIEEKMADETLRENLYEVLNIAASLFNADDAVHLRLYAVHHVGDPLPPDIMVRALTLGRREDLIVDIAGYGGGKLAFVLTG